MNFGVKKRELRHWATTALWANFKKEFKQKPMPPGGYADNAT